MWAVNKKRDRETAISGSGLSAEQEKEAIERGMQASVIPPVSKKGLNVA